MGPFEGSAFADSREIPALERWINDGGKLLLVSPELQFTLRGQPLRMNAEGSVATDPEVDPDADSYILQPTRINRGLRGLALNRFAPRLLVGPVASAQRARGAESVVDAVVEQEMSPDDLIGPLSSPITHLGDEDGSILVDFNFGGGRVLLLTDPFVIANNGIGRGANLDLAINLVNELSGSADSPPPLILFDEYHHGHRNDANPLASLLRGTLWPLILFQSGILLLLLLHHLSRRFTRPVPLPALDRHSPLEFVDSMAGLQEVAEARDLAIENIYPRFRARLCRQLGLSAQANNDQIFARLAQLRPDLEPDMGMEKLREALTECEQILAGGAADDEQLLRIVRRLRSAEAIFTSLRPGRG